MKKGGDIFDTTLSDFRSYLKLERSLSDNTITSYSSDCAKLFGFLKGRGITSPENAGIDELYAFIDSSYAQGISPRSQARLISSVKTLFRFLDSEGRLSDNPCDKIETPKIQRHIPTVLSVEEVTAIIESVDLSRPEGERNRAMLEVLYSCGLRVSELVNLRISDLFLKENFIKVTGKGSKQRLVPIGGPAIRHIGLWMDIRKTWKISREAEDILFVNSRGGKLSRVMVFDVVKAQTAAAGVHKEVSPHTFRHSFASHLVENGADLRVVQEMLGHESILTTEIYTHINTKKWQETILKYHPYHD